MLFRSGNNSSSAGSGSNYYTYAGLESISADTSYAFGSNEIYIPNYSGATYKSYAGEGVWETNGTSVNSPAIVAGLWSNTNAITSVGYLHVLETLLLDAPSTYTA